MTKVEKEKISKNEIINELVKSRHGKYNDYVPLVMKAGKEEPEFLQKLMTWNLSHGEIRDSKVAMPIISLRTLNGDSNDLAENAIANLMTLDPRNLVKAYLFNKELVKEGMSIPCGRRRILQESIQRYLEVREANPARWNGAVLQHRKSMKTLYAISHRQPDSKVQSILFDNKPPARTVFAAVKRLHTLPAKEAAGLIMNYKIPFQIALGALGANKKEIVSNPEFALALMESMSGQQLINSTKMLTEIGVFDSPMLKSEYDKALSRAKKDKKVSTLKAGKAIEVLEEKGISPDAIAKLTVLQEAKIDENSIEGDWLVLGDCSGSMHTAIKTAVEIAGYLARSVKGKVYLIFFNTQPRFLDVSGKTLQEIKEMTNYVHAGGGTSIGCGVEYLKDRNIIVNGIAIVSDGGDNTHPLFLEEYPKYVKDMKIDPPIYFFHLPGERNRLSEYCEYVHIPIEKFELNESDYYSIPNLCSMMKTTRYSLVDEIMQTPLLTLEKVFSL